MIAEAKSFMNGLLALIPFGTFFGAVGSVASSDAAEMHPVQVFALFCGGLASLAVCAWHIYRIWKGK